MLFNSNFLILDYGPPSESPGIFLKDGDSRTSCRLTESESQGNDPENLHLNKLSGDVYGHRFEKALVKKLN